MPRASGRPAAAGLPVVDKTGRLLRALGGSGAAGLTTTETARETELSRPTAHRLLLALSEQGLTDRDPVSGRWFLGPELYLLGNVAATRYDVTSHAVDILADLAERTGESAYLSAARGAETVCLREVEGSFPLRSHVLHEGIRFPLGVASAGLVVLAQLPVAEAASYLAETNLAPAWGRSHSRRALTGRLAAARTAGYAVNPGLVVPGSWGIAAAVFDQHGRPAWALSLTGVESRFGRERIPTLGRLLLRSAHQLTQRLAGRFTR